MYRFEKDDKAVGLIYNSPATGSNKWIDEQMILKSAFNSLQGAAIATLVVGIAAVSF